MIWAFLRAFLVAVSMAALVYSTTIFDKIKIDTGPDEYAEIPWQIMPWYCSMPLNTLINFGYTAVGLYWLLRRYQPNSDSIYLLIFAWMTIIYSVIQSCRIATQRHIFGVLDQWYTLHMISWILNWALSLQLDNSKWSLNKSIIAECLLCLSYPVLAGIYSRGFEVVIGVHFILVCSAIIRLHLIQQEKNDPSHRAYLICIALLCCTGFIAFDLLELYLASLWPSIFTVCSGHFLSRLCDILQIHFTMTLLSMIEGYKYKVRVEKLY